MLQPAVGDELRRDGGDYDRIQLGTRHLRNYRGVMETSLPPLTFEGMLHALRNRVRDDIGVSEDLATAIVTEWRVEAMRRGLIWFEDAYWSEAVVWIEQLFPPGLRSVTTLAAPRVPSRASARPPHRRGRHRRPSRPGRRRRTGPLPP
jgi:hypothetical protein